MLVEYLFESSRIPLNEISNSGRKQCSDWVSFHLSTSTLVQTFDIISPYRKGPLPSLWVAALNSCIWTRTDTSSEYQRWKLFVLQLGFFQDYIIFFLPSTIKSGYVSVLTDTERIFDASFISTMYLACIQLRVVK